MLKIVAAFAAMMLVTSAQATEATRFCGDRYCSSYDPPSLGVYNPKTRRAKRAHQQWRERNYDQQAGIRRGRRGMICGAVQRAHFGVGSNLALQWAVDFPHVSAQPGAVVVQRRSGRALGGGPGGHVSRIIQLTGQCRAVVADEKGQYERDICSRLVAYVMPR